MGTNRWLWGRTALCLAMLAGCPAGAQDMPTPAAIPDGEGRDRITAARLDHLARTVARLAAFDLRLTSDPTEADQRVAQVLLSFACDLEPKDQDLLRRQMEAAYAAGDEQSVLSISKRLFDLDPGDALTQLRLITAAIGRKNQTVEDRLGAYRRFIDSDRFDQSIRSRLALDAALLERERGNDEAFSKLLNSAVSLDPTNKEAAYALYAYLEPVITDPGKRLDLLGYVLMADPLDPNTHYSIARTLAYHGAFKGARRFHTNALNIRHRSGEGSPQATLENLVLQWHTEGPASCVATLTRDLNQMRADAMAEVQRRKDRKLPLDEVKKPEEVSLPTEEQELMVYAAMAAKDSAASESASRALLEEMLRDVRNLRDPLRRGTLSEDKAIEAAMQATLAVHTIRVLANRDINEVEDDLKNSPAMEERFSSEFAIMRAWVRLRRGEFEPAIEALRPLAPDNPMARFGVAMALQQAGRVPEAIAEYRQLVRSSPLDPLAAWARTNARELGDREEPETVKALEAQTQSIPADFDLMPLKPRDFILVKAELGTDGTEAIDRTSVTISVQNLSRFKLGFGPDRPISSKFLLAPTMESSGSPLDTLALPEVVDMSRRLRLAPRERIEVKVWPDGGQTGWVLEALAHRSVRMRWVAVQDYIPGDGGGYRPGVFATSAETAATVRQPLPECGLDGAALAKSILSDTGAALPRLAVAVRSMALRDTLLGPKLDKNKAADAPASDAPADKLAPDPEVFKPLADAFASRYAQLDPAIRAHVLAIAPPAKLAPGMEALDQAAKSETDPLALSVYLVTRVTTPDDPVLVAAQQHADERVRTLAEALPGRLSGDEPCVSRLTPELVRALREGDRRLTIKLAAQAAKAPRSQQTQGAANAKGTAELTK